MNERVRIKDRAIIGCDMHAVRWKDDGEIFEVFPLIENKMRLMAPGYGGKPYGNGPLYVKVEDLVLITSKEAKMAEVKKKRKGQYFIACGGCKQSTFDLTKDEASRTTCPKCGSTRIITDRG